MTRKHFELIAETINNLRADTLSDAEANNVAAKFAASLKGTNPRFREGQFMEACGVPADQVDAVYDANNRCF
jgi:hypothetical protein